MLELHAYALVDEGHVGAVDDAAQQIVGVAHEHDVVVAAVAGDVLPGKAEELEAAGGGSEQEHELDAAGLLAHGDGGAAQGVGELLRGPDGVASELGQAGLGVDFGRGAFVADGAHGQGLVGAETELGAVAHAARGGLFEEAQQGAVAYLAPRAVGVEGREGFGREGLEAGLGGAAGGGYGAAVAADAEGSSK